MKTLFAALAFALLLPAAASAAEPTLPEAQATYAEARKMMGTVPAALRYTSERSVASVWAEIKALQLNPQTALSGKTKELIGLGVAAQIPCQFCVYFHQEAAKLNGATEAELREATTVTAMVRHWATVTDGQASSLGKPAAPAKELEPVLADIKASMGSVPDFVARFPAAALAPAWQGLKTSLMGEGSMPQKDRALLAIAISAQIPSIPCVNSYTELAKKQGASDAEIQEAVAMAALTRAGSTVLNGASLDPVAFKKEVDGIVKFVKAQASKKVAGR